MLFHPEFTELESSSAPGLASYALTCYDVRSSSSTSAQSVYPFGGQHQQQHAVSVTLKNSYAMFAGGSSVINNAVGANNSGGASGFVLSAPLSSNMIVSPSPSRTAIKEANDHLQLLHQRVQELERTVREQAEALIKKDECMQMRLRELTQAKDARIAELSRALEQSGEQTQRLEQTCRDKDAQLEETSRRNAEELGSYVPVLERLVISLRKSSCGRSWPMTNHAANHALEFEHTNNPPAVNDQHFLSSSRVASPSAAVKSLGYVVTGAVPTNHRARKLFKGSTASSNATRQDLRFHPNSTVIDTGFSGDRPASSSSAGHAVPPDMRIGRSFNINSNFSMSDDDNDDDVNDYDGNVENDCHKYS